MLPNVNSFRFREIILINLINNGNKWILHIIMTAYEYGILVTNN